MFGYTDLVVDPRNFVAMRDAGTRAALKRAKGAAGSLFGPPAGRTAVPTHPTLLPALLPAPAPRPPAGCPVTADVTHALQQPAGRPLEGGGVASGGLRDMIPAIARTGGWLWESNGCELPRASELPGSALLPVLAACCLRAPKLPHALPPRALPTPMQPWPARGPDVHWEEVGLRGLTNQVVDCADPALPPSSPRMTRSRGLRRGRAVHGGARRPHHLPGGRPHAVAAAVRWACWGGPPAPCTPGVPRLAPGLAAWPAACEPACACHGAAGSSAAARVGCSGRQAQTQLPACSPACPPALPPSRHASGHRRRRLAIAVSPPKRPPVRTAQSHVAAGTCGACWWSCWPSRGPAGARRSGPWT